MTTDPTTQARHEASLQERERGQREIEDGLRRSNKALTDEVHKLRELIAKTDPCEEYVDQLRAWQAATGCETVEEFVRSDENMGECLDGTGAALYRAQSRIATLEEGLMRVAEAVGEVAIVDGKDKRSCIDTIVHVVSDAMDAKERVRNLEAERDAAQARCAELERENERLSKLEVSLPASLRDAHAEVEHLRSKLEALTQAPEGDVLAERVYGMQSLGFTLNALPAGIRGGMAGDTVRDLEAHLREAIAEGLRLRSQLAMVTADRDWLRGALGDCVKAMELWGSQEDGVPEAGEDLMGSIGKAYDNAKAILRWPDDPTLRKASSACPKPLTADECEQALRRGDTVRVSSMPSPYRVRGGVLEALKGGLWALSLLDVRDIVNDVRNGAECFLVPDPS